MEWRGRYERAAARYAAGETRGLDQRQLAQLGNAAWAAGLSLLLAGEQEDASGWLRRAAGRYRESWDAGAPRDSWGRPIAAMKALLIAGDYPPGPDPTGSDLLLAAEWALDAGAAEAASPIGRYAGALALLVLERDEEAAAVAATLAADFPSDVAAALRAISAGDAAAYRAAVADVRHSFEERDSYLEDIPVADTALALDALASRRDLV